MNENTSSPTVEASAVGILFFIVKLVFLLPLLGVVYSYLQWYIPLFPINPVAPIIISSAAGGAFVALGIKKAGLQLSEKTVYRLGLFTGVIVLYVAWAVWLNLVVNVSGRFEFGLSFLVSNISIAETLALLANPKSMAVMMIEVSKVGTWGLEGWTVSGILLWLCWLIEAVAVVRVAGYGASKDSPFMTAISESATKT